MQSEQTTLSELLKKDIQHTVTFALAEDIGSGDITAQLIPAENTASASVITREDAVMCGQPWFNEVFRQLDPQVEIHWLVNEGAVVKANQTLVTLSGNARVLLTGERTALNFLQTLMGTATTAKQYAELVQGSQTQVLDTRKTIPCLRRAQKYAASVGGCENHRMGLYDAFLIKENHIAACGGIDKAVSAARKLAPKMPVEVEVETLTELAQAINAGADIVMLDNFSDEMLLEANKLKTEQVKYEVSGNLDINNIQQKIMHKVDYVSSGAITKHCQSIDLSMRF